MKLDPRIIDISKILLRNETDEAKKYIGTKCYFGHDLVDFIDVDNECFLGTLINVDISDDIEPYEGKIKRPDMEPYFSYLLPAKFVEEEKPKKDKYVPFETLNDLRDYKIRIGDPIVFFNKKYPEIRYSTIVTEIQFDNDNFNVIGITLGSTSYSLETLCNDYIWHCCNNEWIPFGKRVEE